VGSGRAGGGIDSKATSIMTIKRGGALTTAARAGPTNDDQPPFCWTPRFAGTPHAGHPHCYDFSWQSFEPKLSWFGGPSSPTVPPTGKDDKEKGDAAAVKRESSVGGSFVFPSVTCGRDNAAQLDSSLKDVLEQRNPKTSASVSTGCGASVVTSEFQVSGLTLDDATTFVANAESNNVTALVGISFEQRYGSIRVGAVHIIPTENDGLHNTSAKKRLGRGLGSLFSVVVGTIAGVCIFLAMLRHMVKGESNNSSAKGNEVPHVELQNMEDDDDDDNGEEGPSIATAALQGGGFTQSLASSSTLDSNLNSGIKADMITTAVVLQSAEEGEQVGYHHHHHHHHHHQVAAAVVVGSDNEDDDDDDVLTVGFREAGDDG